MLSEAKSASGGFDVISIGAATVDIFAKSHQFSVQPDISSPTGRSLYLACSSKNEISDGLICSGGGATNSSVSFARFGLKVACLSRTGNDQLYPIISSELNKENVTNLISCPQNDITDYSIILVTDDGARSILTRRGDTCLTDRDFRWDNIKNTKWFYITSLEGNMDLLEQLVGFAKENNIKISLNPGNRELKQKSRLMPLLKHADFLLLNTVESEMLLDKDFNKDTTLEEIINLGPSIASVTDGRNGAYIITHEDKYYSPIINVNPVDETGAGDSFGSGFIAGLIHGNNSKNSLEWAIKNSASVVSFLGAKPGLLTLDQIKS